jgi:hypothetical protein
MSARVKYRSVIDWRTLKRNKWPPLQRNSGELCAGITGDLCGGIVAYYRAEYPQQQYPEIDVKLPLMGGPIWIGEDEAWELTRRIIEKADAKGKLREIIDAIKSNRVQDDFSAKWSFAKEDFERRLYSKRSKVQVRFVEIDDAIPIHSQSSEIDEDILWDDLLSIVDQRERKVIVCLRKGITNHKEISEILGYQNHSPVTKLIARIRGKVEKIFNL